MGTTNRGFWLMLLLSASLSAFATPHVARADDSTTESDDDDSDEASDGAAKKPEPPPPPPPVMPAKIDICMTSAFVSLTKSDGSPWDADGSSVSTEQYQGITSAFTKLLKLGRSSPASVAAQIGLLMARPGMQSLAKPDVFGTVELAPTGSYGSKAGVKLQIASAKKPVRDAFNPNFGDTVCFKGVTWHVDLRLRVDLTDKDLINDDKIATVEVLSRNVGDAFAHSKPIHVFVGDQDTQQLKFVVLNVTKAAAEDEE